MVPPKLNNLGVYYGLLIQGWHYNLFMVKLGMVYYWSANINVNVGWNSHLNQVSQHCRQKSQYPPKNKVCQRRIFFVVVSGRIIWRCDQCKRRPVGQGNLKWIVYDWAFGVLMNYVELIYCKLITGVYIFCFRTWEKLTSIQFNQRCRSNKEENT